MASHSSTSNRDTPNPNSPEEEKLAKGIWEKYIAAYLVKEELGVTDMLSKCEEYWGRSVVEPEDDDDPASNTNIIFPVIEAQVADMVTQPSDLSVDGVEPSDEVEAPAVKTIMEWFIKHNDLMPKKMEFARGMLNFGGHWWKITYNPKGMKGRGFIEWEPVNHAAMFPDPKIKEFWKIQDCDFIIHASARSLNWLVRRFGERAKACRRMSNFAFDPAIFEGQSSDEISHVVADKALLLEYWDKDEANKLRLVYECDGVILWNSDNDRRKVEDENKEVEDFNKSLETWDEAEEEKPKPKKKKEYKGFYKMSKYPFVCVPCYPTAGHIWGKGDTEMLIPIQDIVNDLDDQIRMNARLMGNIQIVVGLASGINLKKWTNRPGLKLPARDHTAWQVVNPPSMSSDVPARREVGKREVEIVSGRADVTEGRSPKGVRAASAIIALQEAGSKRANLKKLMLEWGMTKAVELCYELYAEHFDVELPFRLTGPNFGKSRDFLWHKGTNLQNLPRYIPGIAEKNPQTGMMESKLVPLMKEDGGFETKEAEFDFYFSIGAGLPNNKAFLYQASLDLFREGVITREESRKFLKDYISLPFIDPLNPFGDTFNGMNVPGRGGTPLEQQSGITGQGMPPMAPPPQGMMGGPPQGMEIPPQLLAMLGGMK